MNKEQKKKLSREKRRLQNDKRARLEKELEDMEPVEDDMDLPEEVEKEYYGNYEAKSFSELDQALDAQEKAEKVNETSWMVQDMVRNIIRYPEFSPEEKASAIKSVADEFGSRVRMIMETPFMKEASTEIDVLELEATLARDKRNMSFPELIKDVVAKAFQTSEEKLKDEDFAFVVEREGVKVRKYPIHNVTVVRKNLTIVANDLTKEGVDAEDAREALSNIREAAKKFNIDVSMDKEDNAVQIEKDANGDWRAVMWVSNKFIDRDKEIICEAAHKEYAEWANANKELMPASLSWHTPETVKENHVDFVDYIDGFLVASVKLTDGEAERLLTLSKSVNLGMSHGSFVLERDAKDPRIITKYRMYEVSDLPLKNAANPFTDFETISKEVGMDKLEYLTEILGADKAKAYVEKIGLKKQALEDAQIESKEKTEEVPVDKLTATITVDAQPAIDALEKAKPDLVADVLKALDIDGLNEFVISAQAAMDKVATLEELVKELSANQDEKLAEMIDPPISKRLAWSRPSEDDSNVIKKDKDGNIIKKDDKKLKENIPGLPDDYWLSEATGTAPIKEDA